MTAARPCAVRTMRTWDGASLTYRAWLPAAPSDKALLLLHRGHEHGARWQSVVDQLALDDVAIFAWDARGHGQSSGERGAAESVAALVKDLDVFAAHITAEYGVTADKMILMAHSVGAVVAAAWVHDYAPPLRARWERALDEAGAARPGAGDACLPREALRARRLTASALSAAAVRRRLRQELRQGAPVDSRQR